jgi:hypothetical protein
VKKGLIFLLAVIYITLTSGVVVNIHYCMGRIAGVSYGHEADHKCGKCGMQNKEGCCGTEHKLIKADDDHIYSKTVSATSSLPAVIPAGYPEHTSPLSSTADHSSSLYHSPPDVRGNHLFVHNSIFRI